MLRARVPKSTRKIPGIHNLTQLDNDPQMVKVDSSLRRDLLYLAVSLSPRLQRLILPTISNIEVPDLYTPRDRYSAMGILQRYSR